MHASEEQWRPVVGFEGLYEVSDLGRVRSLDRMIRGGRNGALRRHKGRILSAKPARNHREYPAVALAKTGEPRRPVRVHTLVLEAFVGPRPEGWVACHNDGDNNNNRADNLRWDTYSANNFDIQRHGRGWQKIKTHCKNGHEFTPENTIVRPRGHRKCRTCQYAARDRWRAKQKAIA